MLRKTSNLSLCVCTLLGIVASLKLVANGGEPATTTRQADPKKSTAKIAPRDRWKAAENNTWRWYERESFVKDEWRLTGITAPVHKRTGEVYTEVTGYLDESAVPTDVRRRGQARNADIAEESSEPGKADRVRIARDGRPASKWLRSLKASQLSEWLKTIDVPEAGVEGMTFWEHLTRDHGFDAEKIEGLTEDEQAKLHAAAHAGY